MKRFISMMLVLALVLTVLVGCSNGKTAEKPAEEKAGESTEAMPAEGKEADQEKIDATITVLVPDWGVPSDEMLADFKDQTGITVNVETAGWDDIKQKVSIASAGKNPAADVFEVDWSWVGEFQAAGWLDPIDFSDEILNDVKSLEYFKVGDSYYSLPFINDYRVALLNTEMAGDEDPATYDDLNALLLKAKEEGKIEYPVQFPLSAEEKTTTSFMTLAYTRNGIFFNEDGTANEAAIRDAFEVLNYQLENGLIDPAETSRPGIDTFRGISAGEGAFLIGPTSFIARVDNPEASKVVGQVKSIMLPGKDGKAGSTLAFTEALGVSSFSENKEAAHKFIEYMSSPEAQEKFYEGQGVIPTRYSVIEKIINEGKMENPGTLLAEAELIENPFPMGVPSYYSQMSAELFNIVNQFGQGKLTVDEATANLVAAINSFVK